MDHINKYLFQYLLWIVIIVLTVGTIFYHLVEKWNWLDSIYFCVVTLATVGYGDFAPHTDAGKIFTIFYILTGVGVITTFFSILIQRRAQKVKDRAKSE